ncbi:MAG: hypothetical protein HY364_05515 [Candidatus Aenigmarchaeota archaeon]|nr:hypothetical protein [Candidatus Aenigmarchaeota archaeon]
MRFTRKFLQIAFFAAFLLIAVIFSPSFAAVDPCGNVADGKVDTCTKPYAYKCDGDAECGYTTTISGSGIKMICKDVGDGSEIKYCVKPDTATTCTPGYVCSLNGYDRYKKNSDCSQIFDQYCTYGCDAAAGTCKPSPTATTIADSAKPTISMYAAKTMLTVGEKGSITIVGNDDRDIASLSILYNGHSEDYDCSGIQTSCRVEFSQLEFPLGTTTVLGFVDDTSGKTASSSISITVSSTGPTTTTTTVPSSVTVRNNECAARATTCAGCTIYSLCGWSATQQKCLSAGIPRSSSQSEDRTSSGLDWVTSSSICASVAPSKPATTTTTISGGWGTFCTSDAQCTSGLRCEIVDREGGNCVYKTITTTTITKGTWGSTCTSDSQCTSGLICDEDELICIVGTRSTTTTIASATNQPPKATIVAPSTAEAGKPFTLVGIGTDDKDVAKIEISGRLAESYLCEGTQTSCSTSWHVTETAPGAYNYYVYVHDDTGKVTGTSKTITVTTATTPATCTAGYYCSGSERRYRYADCSTIKWQSCSYGCEANACKPYTTATTTTDKPLDSAVPPTTYLEITSVGIAPLRSNLAVGSTITINGIVTSYLSQLPEGYKVRIYEITSGETPCVTADSPNCKTITECSSKTCTTIAYSSTPATRRFYTAVLNAVGTTVAQSKEVSAVMWGNDYSSTTASSTTTTMPRNELPPVAGRVSTTTTIPQDTPVIINEITPRLMNIQTGGQVFVQENTADSCSYALISQSDSAFSELIRLLLNGPHIFKESKFNSLFGGGAGASRSFDSLNPIPRDCVMPITIDESKCPAGTTCYMLAKAQKLGIEAEIAVIEVDVTPSMIEKRTVTQEGARAGITSFRLTADNSIPLTGNPVVLTATATLSDGSKTLSQSYIMIQDLTTAATDPRDLIACRQTTCSISMTQHSYGTMRYYAFVKDASSGNTIATDSVEVTWLPSRKVCAFLVFGCHYEPVTADGASASSTTTTVPVTDITSAATASTTTTIANTGAASPSSDIACDFGCGISNFLGSLQKVVLIPSGEVKQIPLGQGEYGAACAIDTDCVAGLVCEKNTCHYGTRIGGSQTVASAGETMSNCQASYYCTNNGRESWYRMPSCGTELSETCQFGCDVGTGMCATSSPEGAAQGPASMKQESECTFGPACTLLNFITGTRTPAPAETLATTTVPSGTISGTVRINANGRTYDNIRVYIETLVSQDDPSLGYTKVEPAILEVPEKLPTNKDQTVGYTMSSLNKGKYMVAAYVGSSGRSWPSDHSQCKDPAYTGTVEDCVVTAGQTQDFVIDLIDTTP